MKDIQHSSIVNCGLTSEDELWSYCSGGETIQHDSHKTFLSLGDGVATGHGGLPKICNTHSLSGDGIPWPDGQSAEFPQQETSGRLENNSHKTKFIDGWSPNVTVQYFNVVDVKY